MTDERSEDEHRINTKAKRETLINLNDSGRVKIRLVPCVNFFCLLWHAPPSNGQFSLLVKPN